MQIIKPDINIDFVGKSKIAFTVSAAMILISILSLFMHKGPRYGIDFAGGTLIQVKFFETVTIKDIKSGLAAIDMGASTVQLFGDQQENEFLIRTDISAATSQGFALKVQDALKSSIEIGRAHV